MKNAAGASRFFSESSASRFAASSSASSARSQRRGVCRHLLTLPLLRLFPRHVRQRIVPRRSITTTVFPTRDSTRNLIQILLQPSRLRLARNLRHIRRRHVHHLFHHLTPMRRPHRRLFHHRHSLHNHRRVFPNQRALIVVFRSILRVGQHQFARVILPQPLLFRNRPLQLPDRDERPIERERIENLG